MPRTVTNNGIVSKHGKIPKRLVPIATRVVNRIIGRGLKDKLPHEFLNSARPASSPLHRLFDWNNTTAGEKYRLWQARWYIASLTIKFTVTDNVTTFDSSVRYTTAVRSTGGSRDHFTTIQAMNNTTTQARVLAQIQADMKDFIRKWAQYEKLFGAPLATLIAQMRVFLRNAY